ncbi:thymidine kinase [Psychromonas sp. CD1]|uniref:thymidine kinase n=1 Tax=Psychromonas sp. CD1 TaxID=1979839 RepID=UPI000B9C1EEA|nr:thymidine kinase [Psychromonas sp. CD1]
MAQLYFYYSAMNAGKSTALLQSSYNYRERGMNTLVLTPAIDNRAGVGKVASRIGLECEAQAFCSNDNLAKLIETVHKQQQQHCILLDEAQFLTKKQVKELTYVVDILGIPVLCYGIKTDFQGELFSGSHYLLAWADKLIELKTICHCGRKANMILRRDSQGNVISEGAQIEIGGNESYESVCRKHFRDVVWDVK